MTKVTSVKIGGKAIDGVHQEGEITIEWPKPEKRILDNSVYGAKDNLEEPTLFVGDEVVFHLDESGRISDYTIHIAEYIGGDLRPKENRGKVVAGKVVAGGEMVSVSYTDVTGKAVCLGIWSKNLGLWSRLPSKKKKQNSGNNTYPIY